MPSPRLPSLSSLPLVLVIGALFACGGDEPADVTPPASPELGGGDVDSTAEGAEERRAFAPARASFVDVASELGLEVGKAEGKAWLHLPIVLGQGAAWFDYDSDGDLDAFLGQAMRLAPEGGRFVPGPRDQLFAQGDDGKFADVTEETEIGDGLMTNGCAVADVEGDGDPDLFVIAYGPDRLWLNEDGERFHEGAEAAGLRDERFGSGAAFSDLDKDGFLDVYVANYVVWSFEEEAALEPYDYKTVEHVHPPNFFDAEENACYRNRGDGTFEEVTEAWGLVPRKDLNSFQPVICDLDDDGDLDIYVTNDTGGNYLFLNRGMTETDGKAHPSFEEGGDVAGVSVNFLGRMEGTMGVAMGDVNFDRYPDVFVTNWWNQTNTYYESRAPAVYEESTRAAKVVQKVDYCAWGTGLVDFNRDGFLDLFIANGSMSNPDEPEKQELKPYRCPNSLYFGSPGRFRHQGLNAAGEGFAVENSFRCAAFADYDDDGDVDILVTALYDDPVLLRNDSQEDLHWIGIELVGEGGLHEALGARVTVRAGGREWVRDVAPHASYLATNDKRAFVGLNELESVEGVSVRWPDGSLQEFGALEVDRYHTLHQGGS